MNKLNIKDCKRMLGLRRAELMSNHPNTDGIASIAIERVADLTEEVSMEVQRSIAVDVLDRKTDLFRQVTAALERIAGGQYGACQACQEAISPKRLAALPWAAMCLDCQQAAENERSVYAKASSGRRLGYGMSNEGEAQAGSSRGNDHRLPRPPIPRASANGGAIKSEAQL